jgi:hypothetical protein
MLYDAGAMGKQARVLDVQEMAAFRALLVKLAEGVRNGVASGDGEVRDMQRWLRDQQPRVWAGRIRKLERRLADARETLRRKESTPTPTGEPPNVMLERNAVRMVKRQLDEAKARAERTKLWAHRFEREESVYRGSTNAARTAAQSTLPEAVRTLDDLLNHLEDYLKLKTDLSASGSDDGEGDRGPESMTRPADDELPVPNRADEATPVEPEGDAR